MATDTKEQAKKVQLRPFRGGTQPTVKSTGFHETVTLTTETQDLEDYEIAPTNILRVIYLEVSAVAAGNTATVAFNPDGPLNVLSGLSFHDSGGTAIVGTFDSLTLAYSMKYFGYVPHGDPRSNAVYSAVTGSGSNAGSFNIVFRIPVEAVARTGVASLLNTSTQTPLVLSQTVNKLSAIYATAPTSAPAVTVTVRLGGYWKGANSAFAPAPVAFGTTQYINRTSVPGLNGASQFQMPNVPAFGNPWRNMMLVNYASSARSDTAFPDPLQMTFKGTNLVQYSQNLWKAEMSDWFDLRDTALDTGTGLDTGVYVLPFNRDFGIFPGAELGRGYLMTEQGDAFELIGEWNATSQLYIVVNHLAVKGAVSSIQAA